MTPSDMPVRMNFGNWTNFLKEMRLMPAKWIPTQNGATRKGTRNKSRMRVNDVGYYSIFEPTHPLANKKGYVREHRMVAYDAGLLTDKSMEVHHINGNKRDNRLENLQVVTKAEHTRHHWTGVKRSASGSPCKLCDTLTRSKYGLCRPHYKQAWQRGEINPGLRSEQ